MNQPVLDPNVSSDDRLWAALGYPIAIIAIIVLFMEDKKNRPFIKYHAIQSIILNVVLWAAYTILSIITLGIGGLVCLPILLVTLWPAYKAYQGEYMVLPVITDFMKKQGWV